MASEPRIGIALGAGASTGIAWNIGVLKALHDKIGFDLRDAALVFGTSAGAWVASRVLGGRSLDELAEEQRGPQQSSSRPSGGGRGAARGRAIGLWSSTEEMTPERVKEIATAALSDTPVLEEAEWLSLCATGLPTAEWPETDLRVCAVCCETGERAAFRKDSGVDLLNAVAASCAIPSIFPTVEIRGLHYADGGVWSGGNCDLLLEEEVDVAIFIGSMLGETGTGRVSRRTLEREIKMFADRALTLRTVTPGADFPSGEGALMNPANRELALEAGLADGAAAAPLFHRTPSL